MNLKIQLKNLGAIVDYSFNKDIVNVNLLTFTRVLGNYNGNINIEKEVLRLLKKSVKDNVDIKKEIKNESDLTSVASIIKKWNYVGFPVGELSIYLFNKTCTLLNTIKK